jgi:hypothetical protein
MVQKQTNSGMKISLSLKQIVELLLQLGHEYKEGYGPYHAAIL